MLEAKTQLSRLVEAIETGEHSEIVIARHGRPVARLTTLAPTRRQRRLGVAHGAFTLSDSIDSANPQIAALFEPGGWGNAPLHGSGHPVVRSVRFRAAPAPQRSL
jgi:prevent-host-death family protein